MIPDNIFEEHASDFSGNSEIITFQIIYLLLPKFSIFLLFWGLLSLRGLTIYPGRPTMVTDIFNQSFCPHTTPRK